MRILLFLLLLTNYKVFAQLDSVKWRTETQAVLQTLANQQILSKALAKYGFPIESYQFDGDYSRERVFPNANPNSIICVSPITYEHSIHSALISIDNNYDSLNYQNQLKEQSGIIWTGNNLKIPEGHKIVNSRLGGGLYSEIGRISAPLFNKELTVAIITYGTSNRNSRIKKTETVYILKKVGNQWQIEETISSIKTW